MLLSLKRRRKQLKLRMRAAKKRSLPGWKWSIVGRLESKSPLGSFEVKGWNVVVGALDQSVTLWDVRMNRIPIWAFVFYLFIYLFLLLFIFSLYLSLPLFSSPPSSHLVQSNQISLPPPSTSSSPSLLKSYPQLFLHIDHSHSAINVRSLSTGELLNSLLLSDIGSVYLILYPLLFTLSSSFLSLYISLLLSFLSSSSSLPALHCE